MQESQLSPKDKDKDNFPTTILFILFSPPAVDRDIQIADFTTNDGELRFTPSEAPTFRLRCFSKSRRFTLPSLHSLYNWQPKR